MHVAQDPSRQALSSVCEGAPIPSPRPRPVCEGGSDKCRSHQLPREPGISASEGAKNICKRGRSERISSQRARKPRRTIKSSPSQRRHRVSAPRRDAARDSNYQTYSHSNPPRIEDKIFLQEPDSTDTKTRSNLEGIQPFYSSDRASRGLVCSICEAYFFIQARREATRTKPPIFSREDPLNRYREYIEPISK